MKKKIFAAQFEFKYTWLIYFIMFSCVGQNNSVFIPEPDFSVYNNENKFEIGNIIEIKDRDAARRGFSLEESLPVWLRTFINAGIAETEKNERFKDKYIFIANNRGTNFTALNKWAENFTAQQNFAALAAIRIEERLISSASLFPDDEYGDFFETFVKNAYNTEYQGVVKEETYWFRSIIPVQTEFEQTLFPVSEDESLNNTAVYNFFILLTIEKNAMRSIVARMMANSYNNENLNSTQIASIMRLRQSFFEGF
ncbi:MAG: hypothetical protein FWB86_06665 [Treponema sp.]|nr:hypothetical protein [Treponema sp.]MCL2251291.1 hypothetical protein [Treponema sp.]